MYYIVVSCPDSAHKESGHGSTIFCQAPSACDQVVIDWRGKTPHGSRGELEPIDCTHVPTEYTVYAHKCYIKEEVLHEPVTFEPKQALYSTKLYLQTVLTWH